MNNNLQPSSSSFRQELKLIPVWAIVVAVLLFSCATMLLWTRFPQESHPPSPIFYIPFGVFVGLLMACYGLMVGYVNADSGRRGMNRTVWTLLAAFVPNGVGFILYFLLRQPLRRQCPGCGGALQSGFNYCPACSYELNPHCPKCQRPVEITGIYCPYCGTTMPSRVAPTPAPANASR